MSPNFARGVGASIALLWCRTLAAAHLPVVVQLRQDVPELDEHALRDAVAGELGEPVLLEEDATAPSVTVTVEIHHDAGELVVERRDTAGTMTRKVPLSPRMGEGSARFTRPSVDLGFGMRHPFGSRRCALGFPDLWFGSRTHNPSEALGRIVLDGAGVLSGRCAGTPGSLSIRAPASAASRTSVSRRSEARPEVRPVGLPRRVAARGARDLAGAHSLDARTRKGLRLGVA